MSCRVAVHHLKAASLKQQLPIDKQHSREHITVDARSHATT
jgi:hypothetical protein